MSIIDTATGFIIIGEKDDGTAAGLFLSFLIINVAIAFNYAVFEEKTRKNKAIYGILIGMGIFSGFIFLARNGII